jgi:hypothetical protein
MPKNNTGLFATGIRCFAVLKVSGRSRVPKPAHKMIAFMRCRPSPFLYNISRPATRNGNSASRGKCRGYAIALAAYEQLRAVRHRSDVRLTKTEQRAIGVALRVIRPT